MESKNKKLKQILLILAILILLLFLVYTFLFQKNSSLVSNSTNSSLSSSQTSSQIEAKEGLTFSFINGEAGKNAFEETQKVFKIEFSEYKSMGKFIFSINDVQAGTTHFWKLVVNGEESQTGAEATILKLGDKVEWVYTKIQ